MEELAWIHVYALVAIALMTMSCMAMFGASSSIMGAAVGLLHDSGAGAFGACLTDVQPMMVD